MISRHIKQQAPNSSQQHAQVPKRYRRALQALVHACEPFAALGFPAAYLSGLRSIAGTLRGATWCEYRRAAVLACQAAGLDEAANTIQALKQAECSTTRPGRRYRRRTITREEVSALITKAIERRDSVLAFALHMGWRYGVRAAELMNLRVSSNQLWIRSAKRTHNRGNDRRVTIPGKEIGHFQKYIPLLALETPNSIRMRLYRLCKQVIPNRQGITLHRIRHQVASDLKRSKVPLVVIAKLLGHRSMKSVKTYGDPRRGRLVRGTPPVVAEFEPQPVRNVAPQKTSGPAPSR